MKLKIPEVLKLGARQAFGKYPEATVLSLLRRSVVAQQFTFCLLFLFLGFYSLTLPVPYNSLSLPIFIFAAFFLIRSMVMLTQETANE